MAKGNGKDKTAEDEGKAPLWWESAVDRDPFVISGRAILKRYGIDLSGTAHEKANRKVRELDFAVHRQGGSVKADIERVQAATYQISAIEDRRAAFAAMGRLTPAAAADFDAQVAAVNRNIEAHQRRIDAAAVTEDQLDRKREVDRLKGEQEVLAAQVTRYYNAKVSAPPEKEDQLDGVIIALDKAEARFAAGAAELHRLNGALTEAEGEARSTLARALRDRILPIIAAPVNEVMRDKLAVFERRPGRTLPPEVDHARRTAEGICACADSLTGESTGLWYLARALAEDVSAVLFPTMAGDLPRRRRGPSPAALMNQIF